MQLDSLLSSAEFRRRSVLLSSPVTTRCITSPLAWGEGGIPLAQMIDVCTLLAGFPGPRQRVLDGVQERLSRKGLVRNSTAPAFMAWTVIGMSPWPVMKMMGSAPAPRLRALQIEPAQARQAYIEHQAGRRIGRGWTGTPGRIPKVLDGESTD